MAEGDTKGRGQKSIPSSKLSRVAALSGTGAKVGVNYLKHYSKQVLTGDKSREKLHERNADEVYKTFSKLKGGPLKVAQMLSIDQNLLPDAYGAQFAKAQYSAPPLSYPLVAKTFNQELGMLPTELFDEFIQEAAHGASIGQVHKAKKDGHDYAVKIQYPGVATSLKSDLRVVKPIALQMLGMGTKEIDPYFKEIEKRLLEETDYVRELEKSMMLAEASGHLKHTKFPNYYPEFSSKRVLTMDWIDGVTLDRFTDECEDEELRKQVAQALWDFYDFQIHELKQFHADPHPGNFLVDKEGNLVILDFGCTKTIPKDLYPKYFQLLYPDVLNDDAKFRKALKILEVILPEDTAEEEEVVFESAYLGTELLGRPFNSQDGWFDFGDKEYLKAVYDMGEENRKDPQLRKLSGARGSADTLYINRAYFGLYSLMGRLGMKVKVKLPKLD